MKTCDYVIELLPLYIDNSLDKDELKLVEDHALICEECHSELELYKSIQDSLFVDDIDLPVNFHYELMGKLQLQKETNGINVFHKSFISKYIKYANVAAIFALVMFLSIIGLSKSNIWNEFSLNSQKTSSTIETTTEETTTEETMAEAMEAPQLSMVAPKVAMDESTDETTTERIAQDSLMADSKTDESAASLAAPETEDASTNDIAVTESTYGSEPVDEPVSDPVSEPVSEPINYGLYILLTIFTLGGSIGLVWIFFKHRK